MRVLVAFFVAWAAVLLPHEGWAKVQIMAPWIIVPMESSGPTERVVNDGDYVLKQKLVPMGLAILQVDVASGLANKLRLKAGIQLVAAMGNPSGKTYCAVDTMRVDNKGVEIPNTRGVTLCLVDADGNGHFESAFEVARDSETGLIIQGTVPNIGEPIDAAYETRPAAQIGQNYWVGIRYKQYFNIYGNRMLLIDFGRDQRFSSLTTFAAFKSKGPYPQDLTVLGAKISVLEALPKGVHLRLDASIPSQPFAVFTNTITTSIPIYR